MEQFFTTMTEKKLNEKIETILRTRSFNSLIRLYNSKFIKHSIFK